MSDQTMRYSLTIDDVAYVLKSLYEQSPPTYVGERRRVAIPSLREKHRRWREMHITSMPSVDEIEVVAAMGSGGIAWKMPEMVIDFRHGERDAEYKRMLLSTQMSTMPLPTEVLDILDRDRR